ncbi:MAG: hypothetical protein AAF412_03350, partial [Pseudomonadota bacterium]
MKRHFTSLFLGGWPVARCRICGDSFVIFSNFGCLSKLLTDLADTKCRTKKMPDGIIARANQQRQIFET